MAPELSRREPYHAWAVDMWAFGALAFEMLEGKPAFRGSSMEQLNIRIIRGSHEAFTQATPPPARALIKALLCVDAATRLPARDAIAFEWLGGCGVVSKAVAAESERVVKSAPTTESRPEQSRVTEACEERPAAVESSAADELLEAERPEQVAQP